MEEQTSSPTMVKDAGGLIRPIRGQMSKKQGCGAIFSVDCWLGGGSRAGRAPPSASSGDETDSLRVVRKP